jgi:hypothetical protein
VPPLNIQVTSGQLTAEFFSGQQYLTNTTDLPPSITVSGKVDPVPQGQIYVRVVLDAPVFDSNVGLNVAPPNLFTLTFDPVTTLTVGTYTGNVTVQVFQDAAMTRPYAVTGGTLPYTLTVDPQLTVTVKIDGVLQSETFTSSHNAVTDFNPLGYGTIYWAGATEPPASWTLQPGQVLELESNLPVTWRGPDSMSAYGPLFTPPPTMTATTYSETMPSTLGGYSSMSGVVVLALLDLGPTSLGPGQYSTGLVFNLAGY